MTAPVVAVIGAGTMGSGLGRGLLAAGREPSTLRLAVRREAHAVALHDELSVAVTTDPVAAVEGADVVVLATKPQDLADVLTALAPVVGDALVVSLAAGVTTAALERRLGTVAPDNGGVPVVRVMTNTALGVRQAMSVLSAGRHASPEQRQLAEDLLAAVGHVVWLPEDQQDAASALAGHGAAYLYFLVEVLTQAGIHNGVAAPVARELLVQTMVGAATQLSSGQHPVALREAVSSRGGATIAAFREIERHNVRDALFDAVAAATRRGAELAALAE